MKNWGIHRYFIWAVGFLSVILLILWSLFFFTTRKTFENNTSLQAETASNTILQSIETELLSLGDTAYALSHYDRVGEMLRATSTREFYDLGGIAAQRSESIIGTNCSADNVLVIREDGLFYRLQGQIGNTAVKRIRYLLENDASRILSVDSNDSTYVGVVEKIDTGSGGSGYVCLLTEKSRLESLFTSFSDMEYLGCALFAGDKLICSNRALSPEEMKQQQENALFSKKKDVGLTGFTLWVYCDHSVTRNLDRYFAVAFPLTVLILIMVLTLVFMYLNRHIVRPINSIIGNTTKHKDDPLELTGEAYFDALVTHVNQMLASIEKRDKELYDSGIKLKDYELQAERTLVSLLKKQISAHFTVNTLNAVRALINKDEKEKAARICNELSELLRYANAGEEYITLMEEFYVLEQYASIMETRYPDKFTFEETMEDSYMGIHIPRMLLQPIVENAILHGLINQKGRVQVSATIGTQDVEIRVMDNGKGMDPRELAELRERLLDPDRYADGSLKGIALINVQKRIRLVCGEDYGLTVESKEGEGTVVNVRLPRITRAGAGETYGGK